jgi:O-antigen/teichoic acid export membrane protein
MIRRVLNKSIIYSMGDLVTKATAFFLLPLYTRLLSPEDYGIIAIVGAISSIALPIITFGARGAIHRFYFKFSDDLARREFYGTLWLFLLFAPAVLLMIFDILAAQVFKIRFFGVDYHPFISLSMWTAYIILATSTFLQLILRASEKALYSSLLTFATFIPPTVFSILFIIYWIEGSKGFLWGQMIGSAIVGLLVAFFILKYIRLNFHFSYLHSALGYSAPLTVHFIVIWALASSDRLILQHFTSLAEVGVYSIGYQIGWVAVFITQSGYNAILPYFGKRGSSVVTDDDSFVRTLTYYVFAVTLIVFSVILFTPEIIRIMVDPSYYKATEIVPWVALGVWFSSLYFLPAATLTHIVGDTKLIAVGSLIACLINIVLNFIFVPIAGALGAAMTTAVSYLCLLMFTFIVAHRKYKIHYEFRRLLKIIIAASGAFFISIGLPVYSLWLNLTIKSAIFFLVFPLILIIIRFFTKDEKNIIMKNVENGYRKLQITLNCHYSG